VLIAQAVFLLEHGHGQTDATEHPTHAGGYTASMGNNNKPDIKAYSSS